MLVRANLSSLTQPHFIQTVPDGNYRCGNWAQCNFKCNATNYNHPRTGKSFIIKGVILCYTNVKKRTSQTVQDVSPDKNQSTIFLSVIFAESKKWDLYFIVGACAMKVSTIFSRNCSSHLKISPKHWPKNTRMICHMFGDLQQPL